MDLTLIKIEDVVEAINQCIERKRESLNLDLKGHLILKITSKQHDTFKALKQYIYTLVYHYNGKNIPVIEDDLWVNTTKKNEISKLNSHFLLMLMIFFKKEEKFDMLVHNTYGEY